MLTNTETLEKIIFEDIQYNAHCQIFKISKRWYIDIISIAEVNRELRPEKGQKIRHEISEKIRAEIRK